MTDVIECFLWALASYLLGVTVLLNKASEK
jgi:hypothetical protein